MDTRRTLAQVPQLRLVAAVRNSYFLALSRLYYLALRLVYIIALVQIVGVERYGYFSYAANWYVLLMPLAAWGSSELLISQLALRHRAEQADYAGTSLTLRFAFGLLASFVIAVSALWLEEDQQLQMLMLIFSQGVVVRGLLGWYSAMFAARGQSARWLRVSVLFTTAEVLCVLLIALSGSSLQSLALAQSGVWWVTLFAVSRVHFQYFGRARPRWEASVARELIRRGAALGLATFLLFCMVPGLLVVYRYLQPDLAALGALALALQVFQIANQLAMVVSNALLPALRRPGLGESGNVLSFIAFSTALCIAAGTTLAWLLAKGVHWLLPLLPSQRFDSALLLLADSGWVGIPLLALHVLRLALITLEAVRSYLFAVVCGILALGIRLAFAYSGAGVDAPVVLQSMGVGFGVTAISALACVWVFARPGRLR
ncbi:MAG: hypothetical protein AB8B57_09130 [Congregibacter sp.]